MSVTNVELSNIGQSGLYTYNGDLTVDGLEASILGGRAAYVRGSAVLKNMNVSDTNSDGVLVRGPTLEISDCVIENVGRYFLAAQSSAVKITDSTFNNASSIGLRVASLEMMSSTVSGATTGIRIEETTDSTIENSVISDNSVYGVYGAQSTGMGLDVKTSNIMRNGDRGVRYARALDGNYIAENNGSTDVDDTDSGTLDGVYDTSSTQIYGIDIASNPSDVELTGVGGP
jgi:parallel beta-helix repeat protein